MKHTVALKQNHEFRRLYSKGRKVRSAPILSSTAAAQPPVIQPPGHHHRRELGNAVKRNRARRRIRELYRGRSRLCSPAMTL